MNARRVVTISMILLGFALQALAYFLLAAPIGRPTDVSYSEPRVPFAALVFIFGVGTVFASAIVYEVLPDRKKDRTSPEP
jgi:uncharacterized membrane protein YidH (DUF202 family)